MIERGDLLRGLEAPFASILEQEHLLEESILFWDAVFDQQAEVFLKEHGFNPKIENGKIRISFLTKDKAQEWDDAWSRRQ